jgi:hypothetical protein
LLYMQLREDPDVIYHVKTSGCYNMWIIAKEKIDVKGEIILEGYRSDYYIPYAPDRTWETALKMYQRMSARSVRKRASPPLMVSTRGRASMILSMIFNVVSVSSSVPLEDAFA